MIYDISPPSNNPRVLITPSSVKNGTARQTGNPTQRLHSPCSMHETRQTRKIFHDPPATIPIKRNQAVAQARGVPSSWSREAVVTHYCYSVVVYVFPGGVYRMHDSGRELKV